VNPEDVHQLAIEGDPIGLFDEQDQVGDPEMGRAKTPVSPFDHISRPHNSHAKYVVDLKANYQLSALWLYDINAQDTIFLYSGELGDLIYEGFVVTHRYNAWHRYPLKGKGRFLLLDFKSMGAKVGELVVYGKKLSELNEPNVIQTPNGGRVRPTIGDLIGVNAFNWSADSLLQAANAVREFREWSWSDGGNQSDYPAYPNNQFAWSPGYKFDADDFYRRMNNNDIEVVPCLQLSANWLRGEKDPNSKPLNSNSSSYDPTSYKAHSDYLFQFTARYGQQTHPASSLRLRADQKKKSGMNLVRWVENWNEPDKKWKGQDGYFNPFEMAAMCSADYDGHEGLLGQNVGIKNADPSMKLVLGGLTSIDLHYIRGMKAWSDAHRSNFPVDVINFHHYSNDAGGQRNVSATVGISPEADSLKQRLLEVVRYRDQYLPGVEIWFSEFGYSTNQNSPQRAPAIGPHDTYEMQSRWLVRSFLEIAAAGVDRAHQFSLDDPNSSSSGAFSTAGLTTDPTSNTSAPYTRKPSWFYIASFKNALEGYRFNQELNSGRADVNLYEFVNDSIQGRMLVAWCTTSNDTRYSAEGIMLTAHDSLPFLLELQSDSIYCRESVLNVSNDTVFVNLSEMPILIRIVNGDSINSNPTPIDTISLEDASVTLYLDENGQAELNAEALGLGSTLLDSSLSLWVEQSQFNCSDEGGPFQLDIYSNNSWSRSWYTENSQGFPWIGAAQLPSAATFNQAVYEGQPYTWNSLDVVPNSRALKASSNVTFFRKTFNLNSPQGKELEIETTMYDDMEIYINGQLLVREGSYSSSNSKFPSHKVRLSNGTQNGGAGHQSFDYWNNLNAEDVLVAGENEIVIALRNGGNGNLGGFSMHVKVSGNDAIPVKALLYSAQSQNDTAIISVSLLDTIAFRAIAKQHTVSLNSSGYAIIEIDSIDKGSLDNCSPILYRSVSPDTVFCSDFLVPSNSGGDSLVIISDANWTRSYVTASYSYPFDQININLPSAATFNQPTNLGQPYHWHRVDQIPGTDMIRTSPGISFYRNTFDLNDPSSVSLQFEAILDDYIKIFINGQEVFGTNEPNNWAGGHQFPSYQLIFDSNGGVVNGPNNSQSRAFGNVYQSDLSSILQAGSNELILVAGNKNDANNFGGISFRMTVLGDQSSTSSSSSTAGPWTVPVVLTVVNSDGDSLQTSTTVDVLDPFNYCSASKYEEGKNLTTEASDWYAVFYPNPSSDSRINFECSSISDDGGLLIIKDLSGRIILNNSLKANSSHSNFLINKEMWPKGIYLATFIDQYRNESVRLIIE
jgi:hypothetical protein